MNYLSTCIHYLILPCSENSHHVRHELAICSWGWLMIDLKQPVYSLSQKTSFKVTMWPRSPGQHKENILLLVGDLGVWITTAILHVFIRGGVANTRVGQLERGKRAWPLGTLLSAMVRTVTSPTTTCLGIKCMLRKAWAEKKGVRWSTCILHKCLWLKYGESAGQDQSRGWRL